MLELRDLDLTSLQRFAHHLVREPFSLCPVVLGLCGSLGVGKTRLTQCIASAAGIDSSNVTSPTFTLLQTHCVPINSSAVNLDVLHHLDAYRLGDVDEFWELGVEECWREVRHWTIVEWADRVEEIMPAGTVWITLSLDDRSDKSGNPSAPRRMQITCDDPRILAWLRRVVSIRFRS